MFRVFVKRDAWSFSIFSEKKVPKESPSDLESDEEGSLTVCTRCKSLFIADHSLLGVDELDSI